MPKSKIKLQYDTVLPRVVNRRESKLFIIATEGEKREPDYLAKFGSTNIKVITLGTREGLSSVERVVERLIIHRNDPNQDFQSDDEFWIMIDRDRHDYESLSSLASKSKKERFKIAISNPCFEFWLFLHRLDITDIALGIWGIEIEKRPKIMQDILDDKLNGYDFKKLTSKEFQEEVQQAVRRAKNPTNRARASCPDCPGTDVWKLVEKLPINF